MQDLSGQERFRHEEEIEGGIRSHPVRQAVPGRVQLRTEQEFVHHGMPEAGKFKQLRNGCGHDDRGEKSCDLPGRIAPDGEVQGDSRKNEQHRRRRIHRGEAGQEAFHALKLKSPAGKNENANAHRDSSGRDRQRRQQRRKFRCSLNVRLFGHGQGEAFP